MGKLNLPGNREIDDLGQRVLVVAAKIAFEAKALASSLKQEKFPGSDYRVVESFAVPAACYATVFSDAGPAREVLERMLAIFNREIEEDEQQLLEAILEASVYYNQKHSSVSAAISDSSSITALETIEAVGVGLIDDFDGKGRFLFIRPSTAKRKLLARTEWEHRNIEQVLLRMDGVVRHRHRMAGGYYRGVKIPFSQIESLTTDEKLF